MGKTPARNLFIFKEIECERDKNTILLSGFFMEDMHESQNILSFIYRRVKKLISESRLVPMFSFDGDYSTYSS